MPPRAARSIIDKFLRKIPPTGVKGFEGLVTLLCERITGQRFRLSASGWQHGQDSASEWGDGNRIKVETKRYFKTRLNTRELLGEVEQAADECDLWVLAATCAVSDQLKSSLRKALSRRGVELLAFDRANSGPPRLDPLIAAYQDAVLDWAAGHGHELDETQFRLETEQIRKGADFQPCIDELTSKLRGTLIGFDDARRRSHAKLLQTLSDRGNRWSAFNQEINVRGANANVIPRREICRALDDWWSRGQSRYRRAVVLGEEGAGKTWAVMDWLARKCETDFPALILTVSGGMNPDLDKILDAEEFLAESLTRNTGIGDRDVWLKRLGRWLSGPKPEIPTILLVIDGVNERALFDWSKFLKRLDSEPLRNHVAVLVTDRPAHWEPSCSKKGIDSYVEILVAGYLDTELDTALNGSGVAVAEIPEALHLLIRTPRYCAVVCRNFKSLVESGDFTRERVLYLEYEERARRSGGLSREGMNELLRNLARHCLENGSIDRANLKALVSLQDESRDVLSEISTSGVLVAQPGRGGYFRVEKDRFAYGLGLYLTEEIRNWGTSREDLDDKLAAWFEPHQDMDLKVEIAGSVLFHAYVRDDYPEDARRALLGYWLRKRNWHANAQTAFVDYVLRFPEDFVSETERLWADEQDRGAAEDLLAKAFLRHRKASSVQPVLRRAIERWLGFVHPAGFPILRTSPEREQKTRAAIEARVG